MTIQPSQARHRDTRRYLRVLAFFGGATLNIILWEIVLKRILGRRIVARGRSQRLVRFAARFRRLAVNLGGVMIKLGQFVSARVDVIPPEITDELAGLQDEVPPVPFDEMVGTIEVELDAPLNQVFAEFNQDTTAAASLGQVYRARLVDGRRAAVKVLRPGIERIVSTDLEALRVVAGWMTYWPLIRRRADVPALLDEFADTLWEEVDYEQEADNAERFQQIFDRDYRVYIPTIFRDYSTRRVLTMEDVTTIKISDHAAIDAAGIDRAVVARRLLDVYLRMIFEVGFFHADPHPGNLFLYALPPGTRQPGVANPTSAPFYLIFVDFGMVGTITDEVKEGLREALIAVATRDAQRVIKAYQMLGVILPGADLLRIEQAEQEVMEYIWGKSVPELARMPHNEMHQFAIQYRDILYEMPFQVPQDFIYLARAIGILSGICILLDPAFNPWEQVAGYAQKFVAREARQSVGMVVSEAVSLGQSTLTLPRRIDTLLDRLESGQFNGYGGSSTRDDRRLLKLQQSITRLMRVMLFASFLVTGTLFFVNQNTAMAIMSWVISGVAGIAALFTNNSFPKTE